MAPAVPFALLGVVQLAAVAVWLGFAGAACFPTLRRRTTPLVVAGALAMAVADALTALRLTSSQSDSLGEIRLGGLALLAIGLAFATLRPRVPLAVPAIVVPLGARPSIAIAGGVVGAVGAGAAWLRNHAPGADRRISGSIAIGLLMMAVATALADPARHHTNGALAVLAARAAGSAALIVALVLVARDNLLGKLLGAIVAGVVAMAVGAVAVVGIGVANQVQHDQSQRLLSVAEAQQQTLRSLATRAAVYAHVVALCPTSQSDCVQALKLFSVDPDYFALVYQPGKGAHTIAPAANALDKTALTQLAGSPIVAAAVKRSTLPSAAPSGPLVLHGRPSRLVVIAAVGGRPGGTTDAQVKPTFAAVYGIGLTDKYLGTIAGQTGYDISVLRGGHVIASNLGAGAQRQIAAASSRDGLASAGPQDTSVLPAQGQAPTVAFVPVTEGDNDNVRIATLAISQPASAALAAQRSVLRRLVLTALVVLLVVAIAAFVLAQRIVEPVSRLTAAARQVSEGNLDTLVLIGGNDEIGLLARAFGAMTSSLRGLTGDLRDAAVAEAALRGRLETVVGSMTDGLVTTDGEGLVAGANPMAQQLLGRTEAELVGRPLREAVDVRGADGEPLIAGVPLSSAADAVLRRADETEVPVRVSMAPLVDEAGQVIVLSDRTREREIERMKTEFLSNVSHELRTPLTPIRGYAEILARRPNLPTDQIQKFVGEILAGTTRMSRAVELLVDVAALEAGRVVPQRRPVAVKAFADERIGQWRERYPDRADDLRRRVSPKLPPVDIDPLWLSKALDELVDNAVKYSPSGTPITLVAAAGAGGSVHVAVRDSGPGIDTDRLGELLGDFSQADASETRAIGGFGLGLGFVSRVAQQLGLQLEVTSQPGKGAEFAFDLPVTSAATGRSRSRAAAKRTTKARSTRR